MKYSASELFYQPTLYFLENAILPSKIMNENKLIRFIVVPPVVFEFECSLFVELRIIHKSHVCHV